MDTEKGLFGLTGMKKEHVGSLTEFQVAQNGISGVLKSSTTHPFSQKTWQGTDLRSMVEWRFGSITMNLRSKSAPAGILIHKHFHVYSNFTFLPKSMTFLKRLSLEKLSPSIFKS